MNKPKENLYLAPVLINEIEQLLPLIQKYYEYDHLVFDGLSIRPALTSLLGNPSIGGAYYLKQADNLVGYTVFNFSFDYEFGGKTAVITDLFLLDEYRQKKLGSHALGLIESRCREMGVTAIELQVETQNLIAQRLYKQSGFESLNRLPMVKRI